VTENDTIWKTKYMDLVQRQEEEAADQKETEQILCRTIVRLTLATSGLDSVLDPHLHKLQKLARNGAVERHQRHQLNSLSEALVRAHDVEPKGGRHKAAEEVDLFRRLLDRSRLKGSDLGRLKRLGKELTADPKGATDAQLDELVALLVKDTQPATPGQEKEPAPGLLGRLLGRDKENEGEDAGCAPVRQLLTLLLKLNWPDRMKQDLAALSGKLQNHPEPQVLEAVIRDFTKIVAALLGDLQSEIRGTEAFLSEIATHLRELDRFEASEHALHEASLQSGRELDRVVKQQVGGIEQSVHSAGDLQQLRQQLAGYVETIRVHMDQHMKAAEQRYQESQQNEQLLRNRLQEVERETDILRAKVLEMHTHSHLDVVTELPNRKAYQQRLAEEFARWQRYHTPLVLAIWDLDDFKQINDRFGHQAGDKALHVVGGVLKQRLRRTDFVARYGGEEFAMLFSGSSMEQVCQVSEEIRRLVEKSPFHSGERRVVLTISCGLSEFREGDTPEAVFKRADKALYQAKSEGKNRCVIG
jgi:diguanylate cyclase